MATFVELEGYRIETYERPSPSAGRDTGIRVVRARDGAYVEFGREVDVVYGLLWEHANGTPKEELQELTKEWIDSMETDAALAEANGGTYWLGT